MIAGRCLRYPGAPLGELLALFVMLAEFPIRSEGFAALLTFVLILLGHIFYLLSFRLTPNSNRYAVNTLLVLTAGVVYVFSSPRKNNVARRVRTKGKEVG